MIEQGRLPAPTSVSIVNPHIGKGKQVAGFGIFVGGILTCFAVPPVGVLLIVVGCIVAFVGGCQRWYHWK